MDSPGSCPHCRRSLEPGAEFCPECGELTLAGVVCVHHPGSDSTGACVICAVPYCAACGKRRRGIFLCGEHHDYEIYQGMARVYGVSEDAQARYAASCLEQQGLHAFIYLRKASPISLGGPEYTLFRASGEFDGHIINEVKVMVPVQEVLRAEGILRELGILEG
ncbi:MAG: zinc ribbon domain-containing protein [Bacteroidota bacterium]